MNRTKIEYGDYAWNPVIGCKGIKCTVGNHCWAKRMNDRFHFISDFRKPTFLYKRLSQPLHLKKPSKILTCFMSDFWGEGVKPIWREEVYNVIKACPEHTFFILTKQPQRIRDMRRIPLNCWVGVSVSTRKDWWRIVYLVRKKLDKTFISIEPLIEQSDMVTSYFFLAKWIIVGAMTGLGSKKYKPNPKAIRYIMNTTKRCKIPLFMKNNLNRVWKAKLRQEFPVFKRIKRERNYNARILRFL